MILKQIGVNLEMFTYSASFNTDFGAENCRIAGVNWPSPEERTGLGALTFVSIELRTIPKQNENIIF